MNYEPLSATLPMQAWSLKQTSVQICDQHAENICKSLSFFLILNYRENMCHKLYNTTLSLFVCVCVCFLMVQSGLIHSLKMQTCEDKLFSRHSELAGPINSATGCEMLPSPRVRQSHHSTQTQPAFNRGRNWIYAAKRMFSSHHLARRCQLHAWLKNTHEVGVSVACHLLFQLAYYEWYIPWFWVIFILMYQCIYTMLYGMTVTLNNLFNII